MAYFEGATYTSYWLHRHNMPVNDVMQGTSGDDTFFGGGGHDIIWAGGGDDVVVAGSGDDFILAQSSKPYPGPQSWGHDIVQGGAGNDRIVYSQTSDSVTLYGDDVGGRQTGDDMIEGGSAGDKIFGGGGNDWIRGGAGADVIYGDMFDGWTATGHDTIYGDGGSDEIHGGAGDDVIWGGADVDYLYGGSGADTFGFSRGDSGSLYTNSDVIYDFEASNDNRFVWDKLDLAFSGTASNFGHIAGYLNTDGNSTNEQNFYDAKNFAQHAMRAEPGLVYEFVTDGKNGWLFADLDGDFRHTIDFAIELKGVTDMSHLNIV